jgi:hypothetical protein
MVQDLQVVLGTTPFVATGTEPVVGQAETRRWEQIIAVCVIRERAGFADQRVDDVAVVNRRAIPAYESRQRIDEFVRVPDLDAVGEEPGFDCFADQPTVDRIDVAMNVNQAAGIDTAGYFQARRQSLLGQVPQLPQLLGETVLSACVSRRHGLVEEAHVLLAAGKSAAAAEQERLIDRGLEMSMRRLRVAVLVRLPHIDALARHVVMSQQIAVTGLEFPRRRQVVHGGSQAVAAVPPRHAAQFPQGILETVGQCHKRLRRAERHRLPVRVGQHEVVDQVIERLTGDGDPERVHGGEVRRREIAGLVDLAEHDGLPRSVRRPPLPHTAFEGAAMGIEKLAGMRLSQPIEERLSE